MTDNNKHEIKSLMKNNEELIEKLSGIFEESGVDVYCQTPPVLLSHYVICALENLAGFTVTRDNVLESSLNDEQPTIN